MENGTSLDDILSGDASEAPEQEAMNAQPRDEHGRFASAAPEAPQDQEQQGEQQEAPPASDTEPAHIPFAALKDERSKRQALEQRLAEYEAYFQQVNQPQPEQPDPEQDPLAYLTQAVAQDVLARVQPQTQEQMFRINVQVSEQFARQQWADYDQTVEVFKEECQRNPQLWTAMTQAPNPAVYAYNAGKNAIQARTYGEAPPPSREQIEAEIREKIMAEIGVKAPNVPTSLASAQSRGSRGGPAWSGPESLSELLGR